MATAPVLPATTERVEAHTSPSISQRIREKTDLSIRYYASHPGEIDRRLDELDREWDVERTLETNASALAFTGTVLGLFANRGFLLLPLAVTGFLFQHAVQGWCPPLPVLRRLGFRTASEIERERYALKAVRGDFGDEFPQSGPAARADAAIAAVDR